MSGIDKLGEFAKAEIGKRGGKIIGHTSGGKPVYESASSGDHHKHLTGSEHREAAKVHRTARKRIYTQSAERMSRRGDPVLSREGAKREVTEEEKKKLAHHRVQEQIHDEAGKSSMTEVDEGEEKLAKDEAEDEERKEIDAPPKELPLGKSGIDGLADFAKATPIGGMTPGGYKKVAKDQYVKVGAAKMGGAGSDKRHALDVQINKVRWNEVIKQVKAQPEKYKDMILGDAVNLEMPKMEKVHGKGLKNHPKVKAIQDKLDTAWKEHEAANPPDKEKAKKFAAERAQAAKDLPKDYYTMKSEGAMSGIDSLEEFAKAGVTPIGGITPGGYKRIGKKEYAKVGAEKPMSPSMTEHMTLAAYISDWKGMEVKPTGNKGIVKLTVSSDSKNERALKYLQKNYGLPGKISHDPGSGTISLLVHHETLSQKQNIGTGSEKYYDKNGKEITREQSLKISPNLRYTKTGGSVPYAKKPDKDGGSGKASGEKKYYRGNSGEEISREESKKMSRQFKFTKEGKSVPYEKSLEGDREMSGIDSLEEFAKGGPFIGPKGGKYADAAHKIAWKEGGDKTGGGKVLSYDHALSMMSTQVIGGLKAAGIDLKTAKIKDRGGNTEILLPGAVVHLSIGDNKGGKDSGQVRVEGGKFTDKVKSKMYSRTEGNIGQAIQEGLGWVKKSSEGDNEMSGIEELGEFGNASDPMPKGEPTLGGSGAEQGGKLAGVGKTSGSNDSSAGPPIGSPGVGKKKLSEDDEDDEKQMKPHKKPIEKTLRKGMDNGSIPQGQRDMVAHENAVAVSRLRKGEETQEYGVGVKPPAAAPEPIQKSGGWQSSPDGVIGYSHDADLACEKILTSDAFYPMGAPTLTKSSVLINTMVNCPACDSVMSKSLAVCPECGNGAVHPRVMPGIELSGGDGKNLEKSLPPVLSPAHQEMLVLPNGVEDTE